MLATKPKVTVILPTFNRPRHLAEAVAGVRRQRLTEWELLVINDGGTDVGPIVESFHDPRLQYINLEENRGKAACCNLGLNAARGDFIAYLDDDDLWYPNHLYVLYQALTETGYHAAYTDLFRVGVLKNDETGARYPFDKRITVSRDFNRDFLFVHNPVLHVSLMHSKEAGFRVGGYDESVRAMIDWNLTRKLAFIYDFLHIPLATGEYFSPANNSDRISRIQQTDPERYLANVRRVKADLPPEPWPYVEKVEAILAVASWDFHTAELALELLDAVEYPLRLTLVDRTAGGGRVEEFLGPLAGLKNASVITPGRELGSEEACRFAAQESEADFLLLVGEGLVPQKLRYKLGGLVGRFKQGRVRRIKLCPKGLAASGLNALVVREDFLESGLAGFEEAETVDLEKMAPYSEALRADWLFERMQEHIRRGDWASAREMMEGAGFEDQGAPCPVMTIGLRLPVLMGLGKFEMAEAELTGLIKQGYAPDNLVRLGEVQRRRKNFQEAEASYLKGLDAIGFPGGELDPAVFPAEVPAGTDCHAFTALMGLGECFLQTRRWRQAERMYWLSGNLRVNDPSPFLGYAKVMSATERPEGLAWALEQARLRGGADDPDYSLLLGRLEEGRGRPDDALTLHLKAYDKWWTDEDYQDRLYRLGAYLGRWDNLEAVFTDIVRRNPANPKALDKLALIKERLAGSRPRPGPASAVGIGRNDPCPCGSGKKYKKCCLRREAA
ncbi:MAG: glycosyltransferase [Thermodesulfobacteriota bacterium]